MSVPIGRENASQGPPGPCRARAGASLRCVALRICESANLWCEPASLRACERATRARQKAETKANASGVTPNHAGPGRVENAVSGRETVWGPRG